MGGPGFMVVGDCYPASFDVMFSTADMDYGLAVGFHPAHTWIRVRP